MPPKLQRTNSLKLRKQNSQLYSLLSVDDDLEGWLGDHPCLGGFALSAKDAAMYDQIMASGELPTTPNLQRWFEHVESFTKVQRANFPGGATQSGAEEAKPALKRGNSLQLRKQKSALFADISVDDDLESWLEDHPYVGGYMPSSRDAELYDQFDCSGQIPETPNLHRWYLHMQSQQAHVRASW